MTRPGPEQECTKFLARLGEAGAIRDYARAIFSTTIAMPCPPPMQAVARP